MAKLETYVFVPALVLFTQMTKCTVETFKENSTLILYGFIFVLFSILISYPLSKCFVRKNSESPENLYKRNVYKYALSFGAFGFMGNFIVLGVWGSDIFYKYSLFTILMAILCDSWGAYTLIPKGQNKRISDNLKKGVLSPPVIAVMIGMLFGLLNLTQYVPLFVLNVFDSAKNCQGPIAMILAGFVIGGYNIRELVLNRSVYLITFIRLILTPAIIIIILKYLGTNDEILTFALIAFGTPLGLNSIIYPAAYREDTKLGASMVMVSSTLSVITIPLMYLFFVVM